MKLLTTFFIPIIFLFSCGNNEKKAIKPNHVFDYKSNYISRVQDIKTNAVIKDSLVANLDSEGSIDTVFYYGAKDGNSYFLQIDTSEELSSYYEGCDWVKLQVFDLYPNDNIKEIGVWRSVPNDWQIIRFYIYQSGTIRKIGEIGGACLYEQKDSIQERGYLCATKFNKYLCSYPYNTTFKIDENHEVVEIKKDIDTLNIHTKSNANFTLQRSPSDPAETGKISIGDSVVIKLAYNHIWFLICNSRGDEGWIGVTEYNHIHGTELDATKSFENLHLD